MFLDELPVSAIGPSRKEVNKVITSPMSACCPMGGHTTARVLHKSDIREPGIGSIVVIFILSILTNTTTRIIPTTS
jgi:hypothetical protein